MLKVDIYTLKATKQAQGLTLPKELEEKQNPALLAQAIHVYREKAHIGLAKAKTRGQIARTTKKVYKQKGTGGARHGSKRAPIYVGGGVAHGPKGLKKLISLPQAMRKKALALAMSAKVNAGDVIAVSGLGAAKKTKQAQEFLKKLNIEGKKIIVLAAKNAAVAKTLKNLKDTKIINFKDLNAYTLVMGGKVILDSEIWSKVKKETSKK